MTVIQTIDAMPPRYTRGKKLARVRGELHQNYSTVLATLRPGRGRITADNPLGEWEMPGDGTPGIASDPSGNGSAHE